MNTVEYNFDGITGPTHNHCGLSLGNVASMINQGMASNPKQAAKQGLEKMLALHELGINQAVLPPQERPSIKFLKQCGFSGNEATIIEKAAKQAPQLFQAACSASSMWAANAATVSPSSDTKDGRCHITPANLINKLHRSIEAKTTKSILKSIFSDNDYFKVHSPLPAHDAMGDEGAANHTRLSCQYGSPGLEVFIYGKSYYDSNLAAPTRYPARQTLQASTAIVRKHGIKEGHYLLSQQNPQVIDQGVFHNDVIAVGNNNVLFYHEHAFVNEAEIKSQINRFFDGSKFHFIRVKEDEISLNDAVKSYLFNSQIINLTPNSMAMVLPGECQTNETVWHYLEKLVADDNPIDKLIVKDLRQSMANGGGPACLRLRVVLTEIEQNKMNQGIIFNHNLYHKLNDWIDAHYRDVLDLHSLSDPGLLNESRQALDELTSLLNLGSIYPFQQL